MAKCTIILEDIDRGKYKVECHPDIMKIANKHKNGFELTSAEAKTLLAMAAIKKAILQESVDAKQKQSPIIMPGNNLEI